MPTLATIELVPLRTCTVVLLNKPVECAKCGCMAGWLINTHGETFCNHCNPEEVRHHEGLERAGMVEAAAGGAYQAGRAA